MNRGDLASPFRLSRLSHCITTQAHPQEPRGTLVTQTRGNNDLYMYVQAGLMRQPYNLVKSYLHFMTRQADGLL